MIMAVIEMQELRILTPAKAFDCIQQIIKKIATGTNKNFTKIEDLEWKIKL